MTSIRHNTGPDDPLLDAARACLLEVGWRRTTLTDVARRAGVSRMTLYRRWPDMPSLLADLMTREWAVVVAAAGATGADPRPVRHRLADRLTRTVSGLRDNELFRRIVQVDPELLLPYLLERRGRTQDAVLGLLEAALAEGQAEGSVRPGDPALLARVLVLTAHGFTLSSQTMTDATGTGPQGADLDLQLHDIVERYLAP